MRFGFSNFHFQQQLRFLLLADMEIIAAGVGQIVAELLSSDDEDDEYEAQVQFAVEALLATTERNKRVCVRNYSENVIPRMMDSTFQEHFRMTRATFEVVLGKISHLPDIVVDTTSGGRVPVPAKKQLEVLLWTFGNQESYRGIADRFDVTKSSAHRIVKRMVRVFCNDLGPSVLCWPNELRTGHISEAFKEKTRGIKGIVGAIDGCHIPIRAPEQDPLSYVNRKGFHSVILQAVCDHELLFLDFYAGWPGSVHDARVFRMSTLEERLSAGLLDRHHHIIGDSAYPLKPYLMAPFKGALSEEKESFNTAFSTGRQSIERAFALLKCRWRRLKYLDVRKLPYLVDTIVACGVLHNLCLLSVDSAVDMLTEQAAHVNDVGNGQAPPDAAADVNAVQKRNDLLAEYLLAQH